MSPLTPESSPPGDAEAQAWLAALAARIEDDPDLLASLSDAEVEAALAEEGIRTSGVQAAIRRRLREQASAAPRRRVRSRAFAALALAAVGALAIIGLWRAQQAPPPSADVLAYETTLADFVRPPSKAPQPTAADARSEGAQALLAAARADPPDASGAREAAAAFETAHRLAASDAGRDEAAFFAGLAHRLAGDEAAADAWLRRVSSDGAYGEAAAQRLR